MIVGIPRESFPGERRVAVVPAVVPLIQKLGPEVLIEPGAGVEAGFPDAAFVEKGARLAVDRADLFARADVVLQVVGPGANPATGAADLALLRAGQTLIAFCDPLGNPRGAQEIAATGARVFSMELIPRITRAQSMDALSSMATLAGYKAVLLAAQHLPRIFPQLMTAAGTLAPARVFVVGVGVAGLQAIATARRLGAVVEAYDVRPAVKEQVLSVGAKFVELPLETTQAEGQGGYAKAQGEDFYRRQRELMTQVVAANDVVITTAAVPGKRAPVLITADMVHAMTPGSVLVDIAAERGGNCELTRPGEIVHERGVTILGPLNIPATVPNHASQMYARNITTLLKHLLKDGQLAFDPQDEIVRGTLVTDQGRVVHPQVAELLQSAPPQNPVER